MMAGPCGPAKMVLVLSSFFKNIEKMAAYGCHFFKILAKNHGKKKPLKGKFFPLKGKIFPLVAFFSRDFSKMFKKWQPTAAIFSNFQLKITGKKKPLKGKFFPLKGKFFPLKGKFFPLVVFFFPGLFLHSTLEKCEYIKKSNLFFFFSRFFSISGFDQRFVSFRWLFSMVSKQKRPLVSLVAFSLFDHGKQPTQTYKLFSHA